MIQRPQTIFLAITVIMMLLAFALPNWQKTSKDGTVSAIQTSMSLDITKTINGHRVIESKPRYYIAGGFLLVAGLAAFSISQYKKRMLQMKVGFGITLSIAATLIALMLGISEGEKLMEPSLMADYHFGFFAPFIALICNIITNRLIRKDERLVRSMDRIR